jgi:hypothetical protein
VSASIADRIARLERRARRDRMVALGALAIVLATAQAPSTASNARPLIVTGIDRGSVRLDASGIVVRDAAGSQRADAGIDPDGSPGADLYDTTATIRAGAYLLKDQPLFRLFDTSGKRRIDMYLSSGDQNPQFDLRESGGTTRLDLFIGSKGVPGLAMYGTDGKARAYFDTDDASPFLVMKDQAGSTRVVVGGYTSGKIGADIRDASGTVLWSQP